MMPPSLWRTRRENIEQYQQAQSALKGALDIYVNAVREAYPDLKANTNFMALQTELEGTENRISTERKRYTEAVMDYNTSIKKFPTNIYAGGSASRRNLSSRLKQGRIKPLKEILTLDTRIAFLS